MVSVSIGEMVRRSTRTPSGTVGDEGDVGALPDDVRLVQRDAVDVLRDVLLDRAVELEVLEEEDRVIVLDRRDQQTLGVIGGGRGDHAQTGDAGEDVLDAVGVQLGGVGAAAVRGTHGDRLGYVAGGAEAVAGHLPDQRVRGLEGERGELDLRDGTPSGGGQSDRQAQDAGLRQRGVEDTVLAELVLEPLGGAEDAAVLTDVLAEDEGLRILRENVVEGTGDGLDVAHGGHGYFSSASAAAASSSCLTMFGVGSSKVLVRNSVTVWCGAASASLMAARNSFL